MRKRQGYFSLVQYSEFPERAEFVNIGVILFANEQGRVFFEFVDNASRVKRVFGVNPGVDFRDQIQSLSDRLLYDFSGSRHREDINRFIEMRSGKIRLSHVRSVLLIEEPQKMVLDLFSEFVIAPQNNNKKQKIDSRLKQIFVSQNVENLLESPPPQSLPYGGDLKANYAYQNGSYNLIKGLSLDGDPDSAWDKASPAMTKGNLLFQHSGDKRKKLIVACDVSAQDDGFISELAQEMERHRVGFYKLSDMDHLVDDIKRNADVDSRVGTSERS